MLETIKPTNLPTNRSTKTPLPTLSLIQAHDFAWNMVKTNGGCQLPCWFGIYPGITKWEDARAFLVTFVDDIEISPIEGNYSINYTLPENSYRVSEGGINTKGGASVFVKDGIVKKIRTSIDITLPELLTTYGAPNEIRLYALGYSTIDPIGRFEMVLFYAEKGIMAVYNGKNEKGKIIEICPNKIQGPQGIWLMWSPNTSMTFKEAGLETNLISSVPPPSEAEFIPIEKLTDLDVMSFTQRYKDSKNQGICMKMQAPDWPTLYDSGR